MAENMTHKIVETQSHSHYAHSIRGEPADSYKLRLLQFMLLVVTETGREKHGNEHVSGQRYR